MGGIAEMDVPWKLFFESSPYLVLVLRPDAPRFTMLAATRARFAATHVGEDSLGRGLFEVFTDNPGEPEADGIRNLRASLHRVLETRAADTMAVQKYDIRRPDGSFEVRYWSPRNVPVLGEQGEIQYVLHCVEDVTALVTAIERGDDLQDKTREMEREVLARSRELSAANRELREANVQLGKLDTAKTTFFSNVSHELRTPLTLMLAPLEDALADVAEPLGDRQRARTRLALTSAQRLLKLVNALLDFSRLEAGRLKVNFAPVDLSALTAEIAGMFQSASARSGVALVVDCPPLPEPIWVDPEMWEKVVTNLVGNAHKYTLRGTITVRTRIDGDLATLEVTDTGVGIPEAEREKVFERFHRVADAVGRTHEGTGIGLSLVKELVALHGGTIGVESTLGRGSTFRVTIPRGWAHHPPLSVSHRPPSRELGASARAQVAEIAQWSGGVTMPPVDEDASRTRVLLVEDNADLRSYMTSLLAPHYSVVECGDGVAALESAATRVPDIVVSDVMMPRMDGIALVRALRARTETKSVPVILLSAQAGEDASIQGLDAGADDYVVKPFSARELLARVRTHVELARVRRACIAALEDANRELDAFSYSVSHDLRAPLRSLDGFSHALLEDHSAVLDAQGRQYLLWIRESAQDMAGLIDALLALARVARGELVRSHVDVTRLAREIGEKIRVRSDRTFALAVEEGLEASADENLLRVVFENLLGNASKFTSKIENATIEVGSTTRDGTSTYYVRDNGAGFDMAFASRLFGAFQRLHSKKEFDGHGIGLATVQRVVHRHHGRIWAEGALGKGATFYFTLSGSVVRDS